MVSGGLACLGTCFGGRFFLIKFVDQVHSIGSGIFIPLIGGTAFFGGDVALGMFQNVGRDEQSNLQIYNQADIENEQRTRPNDVCQQNGTRN